MEKRVWGWHLSVDASCCDRSLMQDYNNIYRFNKELIEKIDMEAYQEPRIVHFGKDEKSGYTLDQLISTSNICCHFSDDLRALFLDVFSCKAFEIEVVLELVKDYFGAKVIEHHFTERACIL